MQDDDWSHERPRALMRARSRGGAPAARALRGYAPPSPHARSPVFTEVENAAVLGVTAVSSNSSRCNNRAFECIRCAKAEFVDGDGGGGFLRMGWPMSEKRDIERVLPARLRLMSQTIERGMGDLASAAVRYCHPALHCLMNIIPRLHYQVTIDYAHEPPVDWRC
jgi:hypothetical protein